MKEQKADIGLLNYFKDLYSGHKIIYVRFLDTEWIFRTLTRKEYKYILAMHTDRMDIEDTICSTACLFPEEYDFGNAGFAGFNEYVAGAIEDASGVTNIQSVIDEYHKAKDMNSLEIQCMDLIKAFIPEYTYEEMEEWTWGKLMQMTVRAEHVATLKGFDWHIEDKSEEYMEQLSEINMDNKEFIKKLKEQGVDPMYYFADELRNMKREVLDFPLIGGIHWNNGEVLDVIREQVRKKNAAKGQGQRN